MLTTLRSLFGLFKKRLGNKPNSLEDYEAVMTPVVEWATNRASLVSSVAENETEDSGGTLRVEDYLQQPTLEKTIENRRDALLMNALREKKRRSRNSEQGESVAGLARS